MQAQSSWRPTIISFSWSVFLLLSCPGQVVTDDMANAEGKVSGDEYFANLDYIEGVEKVKEGYESTI